MFSELNVGVAGDGYAVGERDIGKHNGSIMEAKAADCSLSF